MSTDLKELEKKELEEKEKKELNELKRFFEGANLPTEPVQIAPGQTVIDIKTFIETSLTMAFAQIGNTTFNGCLHRLRLLKKQLLERQKIS